MERGPYLARAHCERSVALAAKAQCIVAVIACWLEQRCARFPWVQRCHMWSEEACMLLYLCFCMVLVTQYPCFSFF